MFKEFLARLRGRADRDSAATREEDVEQSRRNQTAGQMDMPGVGQTRNASDAAFKPPR